MKKERYIPLHNKIKNLRPSATLAINERSATLSAENRKVYRLGFGQSPFPVPKEVTEALQAHAHEKSYLPVKGLSTLREAVANFYCRNYKMSCTRDDVLIGPGSKELILNLQIALNADLLLPSPSWVSYEPQAQLVDKKVHWLATKIEEGYLLKADTLERFCKKNPDTHKILLLNYPNNPVGNTYPVADLRAIANVAKKYDILILADEIYGEVHHQGAHQSIAQYYPTGTIISSGLSKWCGAGGWRLGTFLFPENLRYILEAMAAIASETFTSVSSPIQYAAVTAFEGSEEIDRYLQDSRRILQAVGNYTFQELSSINIEMPATEGGFYLFPDFQNYTDFFAKKNIYTSVEMCEALLTELGVALLPGTAFGHAPEKFTARLSFVDFNGQRLLELLKQNEKIELDEKFIKTHCPNITTAIKRITNWLSD
ncbi:MAG: aspartate aminotransferase [Saprospiraceae bacterium]|jgi:aspartate aminotransferase